MKIYLHLELDPGDSIQCECGEVIDIDPEKIRIVLGDCEICQCAVGIPVKVEMGRGQ